MEYRSVIDVGGQRRRRRVSRLLLALVLIIGGLACLVWPLMTASIALGVILGSVCAVSSVGMFARGGAAGVFAGLILLFMGALALIFPSAVAQMIVAFAGFGLIVLGSIWIAAAARFVKVSPLILVPGIIFVIGGVLALTWPSAALIVASVSIGICMIVVGVLLLITRRRTRDIPASNTTLIV